MRPTNEEGKGKREGSSGRALISRVRVKKYRPRQKKNCSLPGDRKNWVLSATGEGALLPMSTRGGAGGFVGAIFFRA